ncbi:MAG: trimethylamine methyltransferase family protein, partial [Bacillota bacterium]
RVIRRIYNSVNFASGLPGIELIKELGPGGVYLDQKHTVEHMREELTTSALFDRDSYDSWVNGGQMTAAEKARGKVKEILAGHQAPPLSSNVKEEMQLIIKKYS